MLYLIVGITIILFLPIIWPIMLKTTLILFTPKDDEGDHLFKSNGIKIPYGLCSHDYIKFKKSSLYQLNRLPPSLTSIIFSNENLTKEEQLLWDYTFSNLHVEIVRAFNRFSPPNLHEARKIKPIYSIEVIEDSFFQILMRWKLFFNLEYERLDVKRIEKESFKKSLDFIPSLAFHHLPYGTDYSLKDIFLMIAKKSGYELLEKNELEKTFSTLSLYGLDKNIKERYSKAN